MVRALAAACAACATAGVIAQNTGTAAGLSTSAKTEVPSTALARTAEPPGQTLQRIQATGRVVIGHRESSLPMSYVANGVPVGYSVDVCLQIAQAIGRHLQRRDLRVDYRQVTSGNRFEAIERGDVDLECGSTTNSAARQKDVAFAVTTYVEEVRTVVKANSGITSIKDLNGKTIATTTGTTSVQTLRKHERAGGIDFKEVFGKDHADSFLMLETGRADAFVMDGSILAANISKSKNPADYKIVGEVLSVEPIACMLRKDDPAFKKAVDDSIKRQIADGSLAKLYDKWFMQPVPPTNTKIGLPMSDATKAAWASPNDKPMEDYAKK